MDLRHAQDSPVERVDIAGDDALCRAYELRERHYRVSAAVRLSRMPAAARHADGKPVNRRVIRPRAHLDRAGGKPCREIPPLTVLRLGV